MEIKTPMNRSFQKWLLPWMRRARDLRKLRNTKVEHVFLCVCDHFEPLHHTDDRGAIERLQRWSREYPALAHFRDSDGRGPRHTFFYPIEQYDARHVEMLAALCRATGSEIEVQLHHDGDDEASLRKKLCDGINNLRQHGCLSTDEHGRVTFGFVHGNWALCNSRPDGRWCGVANELRVLRDLGCYADFTFPSAPSGTQPRSVNMLGYARECGGALALDHLAAATVGSTLRESAEHLLLVQGPLALNWRWRKWGVLPRLENGDLTKANPPTPQRLRLWIEQRIHVAGRPEWAFIKVHSHGAVSANSDVLLGPAAELFHQAFTESFPRESGAQVHYVTAREMANLVFAAEDDAGGVPAEFFNHYLRREARGV